MIVIGAKFGRLVVLERVPKIDRFNRFRCLCDCGSMTEARGAHLTAGQIRSCGCLRQRAVEVGALTTKDMVGRVVGRLTVLEGSLQANSEVVLSSRHNSPHKITALSKK
jgi:hypothetical protein